MADEKIRILIAFFDDVDAGEAALGRLKSEGKERIQAAVVVQKDDQGGVRYKDVGMTPAKGAVGGLALGALVGVLTGGLALVLGALGGLVGGIVGRKQRDNHISAEQVNQLVAAMEPSTSALLAVVDETDVQVVEAQMALLSADVVVVELPEELLNNLEQHRDKIHASLQQELE
jgi:uncharacterized membrane protein